MNNIKINKNNKKYFEMYNKEEIQQLPLYVDLDMSKNHKQN